MTVICGGIAIKSIPAIRDFINPDRIEERIVKLREREGQRVDLGRSLKGHL